MRSEPKRVAVTGAGGFIGRNLMVRLAEQGFETQPITRETPDEEAKAALGEADVIFHLAGANRPEDPAEFMRSNRDYAAWVADAIAVGRHPLVICSSSEKANDESEYGRSKRAGDDVMLALGGQGAATVAIYRLPNIFGKWARPNYNSAVATFCHNLARGLPIRIDDAAAPLRLLYIDDLVDQWLELIPSPPAECGFIEPVGVHATTVGALAKQLRGIAKGRVEGQVGEVGHGLARKLYATFVSALPEEDFSYPLTAHEDPRGIFSEVLKTPKSGQVSFFTALPGVTRGGHYHHSKVEKFVIVHGKARFRFRHIATDAMHELLASADHPRVVESIPGWAHDVANIGEDVMVALIWANEPFDPERPDTVPMPV